MTFGLFRSAVSAALVAGVLSGLMMTALQQWWCAGVIAEAERYEQVAPRARTKHEILAAQARSAHEQASEWTLQGPVQRLSATAVANSALGVGFALLISAVIVLRGSGVGRHCWLGFSLAGYTVFFVAPSIGLPPELPGIDAGPVGARQIWWVTTTLMTMAGLWLVTARRSWPVCLAACGLIVLPHLVGAPVQLAEITDGPPRQLQAFFVIASTAVNAVFWLALGMLTCFFHNRTRLKK